MGIERAYIRQELNRIVTPTCSVQESGQRAEMTVEALFQHGFSSQQAEAMLTRHAGAWKRTLIRFLFAHKETLKHLPVVGGILVRRKNAMLQEQLKQVNNQIDLSDCIGWYRDDFIVQCYQRLLGRSPDPEGMGVYTELARQGADNCVIAYAVAQSPEFGGRAVVAHLAEYRKIYKKFTRHMRLKHIPVLGRFIQLLMLPSQISLLNKGIERSELVVNATAEHLAQQFRQQLLQAQESVLSRLSATAAAQEDMLTTIQRQAVGHRAIIEALSKKIDGQFEIQQECSERLAEVSHIAQEFKNHAQEQLNDLNTLLLSVQEQTGVLNALSLHAQEQSGALNSISLRAQEQLSVLNSLSHSVQEQSGVLNALSLGAQEQSDALNSLSLGVQEQSGALNALSLRAQEQSGTLNSLSHSVQEQSGVLNSLTCDSGLQLSISTSLSEKLDALPPFIAGNSVSSHTAVSGFSGGVIGVIVDQFLFGVPSEEWGTAMVLSQWGHFEPGSERLFESLLKPGMTVLDVGANLGIYTLRALRLGCRVFAYEPTPRTAKILKQNIKANGFAECGRVCVIEAAVSNMCGTADFYQNPDMCGHNSFYTADAADAQTPLHVQTITLDSQRSQLGHVDFIKLDVEGAEYFALCGMRELLLQNRDIQMILEFAPVHMRRAGVEPTALLSLLRELGFSIFQIDENSATTQMVSDGDLLQVDSVNLYVKRGQL